MVYSYQQKIRKILRIALPAGANQLLDIIVLALALLFMGQFSKEHINGISLGMQYMMLFYALNAVFYTGTNAQISRYFGAKDSHSASRVFYTLFSMCVLCAIPLILISVGCIGIFIRWINASEVSSNFCATFLNIAVYALPAMLLKNIITSAFAAIGNTLSIFLVRIATSVFSVVLLVLLIFNAGLELRGAAIANVIVAWVELVILLILTAKKGRFFTNSIGFTLKYFYTALKIGIPTGIERLLTFCSLVLTTKFLVSFGDTALAGSQIGSRIEAFAFMPGFGFMVAAMVLTGQNLGANRISLAQEFNKAILQVSSVVMGILGIIMAVFAPQFSSIFLDEQDVVRISMLYLLAVGFSQVPQIWVFVLDGALRGAGITNMSLAINVSSIWMFRIFPMWLAIRLNGAIEWIFIMIFLETYIRAGLFYLVYKKGSWKRAGKEI